MTALLDHWPILCLSAYGVIVAALLVGNHRWARTRTRTEHVVLITGPLPPVPGADAHWLDPWPHDMTQEQCDRLFDDLIALEGLQ